jgi:Predicted membrane protein (DUF2142)
MGCVNRFVQWLAQRPAFCVVMALGMLTAIVNPPYGVNDEDRHLARVFEITRGRLITAYDEHGEYHMVPPDYVANAGKFVGMKRRKGGRVHVADVVAELHAAAPGGLVKVDGRAAGYPAINYLPQIVGVALARLLHGSGMWALYLGRFASVIAYAFAVQWAFQNTGSLRNLFLALGCIPMAIVQAAAVSGDGALLGAVLVFMALVTKGGLVRGAVLSRAELVALPCLLVVATMAKPVYLTLAATVLIVRWQGPRPELKRWSYAIGSLVVAMVTWWSWTRVTADIPSPDAYDPVAQIQHLREEPYRLARILMATTRDSLDELFLELFVMRTRVSERVRYVGAAAATLNLQLLLVLAWGSARRFVRGQTFDRLFASAALWLATFAGIFAVTLAFYVFGTKTGRGSVHGLQGRYFIPFVGPGCLALGLVGRPSLSRWFSRRSGLLVGYIALLHCVSLGVIVWWSYF